MLIMVIMGNIQKEALRSAIICRAISYSTYLSKIMQKKRDGKRLPARYRHAYQHGVTDLLPEYYRRE